MRNIPYRRHRIERSDIAEVVKVLESDCLSKAASCVRIFKRKIYQG